MTAVAMATSSGKDMYTRDYIVRLSKLNAIFLG